MGESWGWVVIGTTEGGFVIDDELGVGGGKSSQVNRDAIRWVSTHSPCQAGEVMKAEQAVGGSAFVAQVDVPASSGTDGGGTTPSIRRIITTTRLERFAIILGYHQVIIRAPDRITVQHPILPMTT